MLPKAILFDLDDTLIVSDSLSDSTWKRICEEFFHEHKELNIDTEKFLKKLFMIRDVFWGDPDRHKKWRKNIFNARLSITEEAFEDFGIYNKQLAFELADKYTKEQTQAYYLNPETEDVLNFIKNKNIKMYLMTNGSTELQRQKIVRFDLEKYFEKCFIEEEIGYGKPEIEAYNHALQVMGTESSETWIIGDNYQWEIAAPKKLGFFTVYHDYKQKGLPRLVEVFPDEIINTLGEIKELILKYEETA